MDIFSQKKILISAVIVLVVLNLFLVGVLSFGLIHSKQKRQPKPVDETELAAVLKKELNLSEQQAEELKNIRTQFFQKEKVMTDIIRSKRDSVNLLMFGENVDDGLLRQLAARVSENEYKMELLRIEQAEKVRAICNGAQLRKLQNLVKEIRDYLRPAERK